GSYPLLVGVPYRLECGRRYDVIITDWGFRSVTGLVYPFDINHEPMTAVSTLPGIGKKRAASIVRYRPFSSYKDMGRAIDDPTVIEGLKGLLSFE
ncbi:MAG: radical SAM protein, partial [Candidatus Methanomethylophilaceae archaeon]|nr:radical SAM protein [Candidatus Methanomethylophilaceae archaeon]